MANSANSANSYNTTLRIMKTPTYLGLQMDHVGTIIFIVIM